MERAVAFIGKANYLELRLDTSAGFDEVLLEIKDNLSKSANFFFGTPYVKVLGNLETEHRAALEDLLINSYGFEKVYFYDSEVNPNNSLFNKKVQQKAEKIIDKRAEANIASKIEKPSFFDHEFVKIDKPVKKSSSSKVVGKVVEKVVEKITENKARVLSNNNIKDVSDVDKIKKAQEKARNLPFEMGVLKQKPHNVKDEVQNVKESALLSVFETIRSGQTVKYNGDIIVYGDVNRGAELVASGNITVLGILRGIAHAGSAGDEQTIVAAFKLIPQQLRIGSQMAFAPDQDSSSASKKPEYAFVEKGKIIIKNLGKQLKNN